ncbi:MAG: helix-turn-helix domain-containing protein [Lentilitoribacter sp.]
MQNNFGISLKEWRGRRRMSQMDLGLSANISARHISFLETGRSRPSQSMVMMLCDTLDMPVSARNAFLTSAGFAPLYKKRDLSGDDMTYIRAAVSWTLQNHDPYPAFALDRHWNVVKTNRAASLMLGGAGLSEGSSLLNALLDDEVMGQVIENHAEVLRAMYIRLRTENEHLGGDEILDEAIEGIGQKLEALDDGLNNFKDGEGPAVIPAVYKMGDQRLSFFSTIAQFGSTEDIALSELKIEMLFPTDDATKLMLEAMAD